MKLFYILYIIYILLRGANFFMFFEKITPYKLDLKIPIPKGAENHSLTMVDSLTLCLTIWGSFEHGVTDANA